MTNRSDLSLLQLGAPLPSWDLETIFGEPVPQKEDFLGKPLLILFFSLGCPGCLGRAIPFANRMVYEKGDQLAVLGIHTNFSGAEFEQEAFAQAKNEFHIRFPFYKDYNFDTTFLNYGAGGTPHWILVDRRGVVRYSIFGSDPNNALLRLDYRINEVLSSAEVETTEAHSLPQQQAVLNWTDILRFANRGNLPPDRRVEKTDQEWRAQLTKEQFRITRQKGTERAHSSELCTLFTPGVYRCVNCQTPLFDSQEKYSSGSGWPAFSQPTQPNAIAYHKDRSHGMYRIEATCNTCDAHLGHVFPDGPAPSGLRYCMNAVALEKV